MSGAPTPVSKPSRTGGLLDLVRKLIDYATFLADTPAHLCYNALEWGRKGSTGKVGLGLQAECARTRKSTGKTKLATLTSTLSQPNIG